MGRELDVIVEPFVEQAYEEVTGVALAEPLTKYESRYTCPSSRLPVRSPNGSISRNPERGSTSLSMRSASSSARTPS